MQVTEFEKKRCRAGLHHTHAMVREKQADVVFATSCCDRLFTFSTNAHGQMVLMEIQVDREKLAELRQGPEWEKATGG